MLAINKLILVKINLNIIFNYAIYVSRTFINNFFFLYNINNCLNYLFTNGINFFHIKNLVLYKFNLKQLLYHF